MFDNNPNIQNSQTTSSDQQVVNSSEQGKSSLSSTELDSIFGQAGDVSAGMGTGTPETVQGQQQFSGPQDWEKMAKTFQSNYDKTKAEYEKVAKEMQEVYHPTVEFLNQIYEDAEVRQAFIAELEPDLIKQKDPYAHVQEALAKEFGTDFTPDRDEAATPGTKSWFYNFRAQKLAEEVLAKGSKTPPSLKALREKRQKEVELQKQEAATLRQEIIAKLKWDDATYNRFAEWGNKSKLSDFAEMYDRIEKFKNRQNNFNPPSVSSIPGSAAMSNQYKQELDKFFGAD